MSVPALVFAAAAALGLAAFVRAERWIYFWDHGGYWLQALRMRALLLESPAAWAHELWRSMCKNDHNLLHAAPVSLALLPAGESRLAYVLALHALYAAPALLLAAELVRRLRPGAGGWAAALAPLGLPVFWTPIARGMPDVGGLIPAYGVMLLHLAGPPGRALWKASAIGLLLAAMVAFRRWYAFWAASFLALAFAEAALARWGKRRGRREWRRAAESLAAPAVMALSAAGALLLLVPGFLRFAWSFGYADAYSAWDVGRWRGLRMILWGMTGLPPLAAVGLALPRLLREPLRRRFALFSLAQMVLVTWWFTGVQSFGPHHAYLLLAALLPLLALSVQEGLQALPRLARPFAVAACLAWGCAATGARLLPAGARPAGNRWLLLPWGATPPLLRDDLGEVLRLGRRVQALLTLSPGAKFTVVASSDVLNDEVLTMIRWSLGVPLELEWRNLPAQHVDKRDGFPVSVLRTDLAVVADPPQLHLRPDDQRVMSVAAESFLRGTGPARAFEELPDVFRLGRGVTVRLFRRVRPNSEQEGAEIGAPLRAAYPDRPFIYSPPGRAGAAGK